MHYIKAIVTILTAIPLLGLSQATVGWYNYPGGVAVAVDAANNVYSVNWDYNPAGDITLTKRDDAGNILWETAFDNTNPSRHEVATWVETDSQGNILVSGTIRSGYSNPVDANSLIMKFDPLGNLLWRVIYETEFDGSSTRKCLVDAEDNVYVLGFGNSGTGLVAQVKKFSPEGVAHWTYFDEAGIGKPVNFKFTPDGGIIITARSIYGSINGFARIDLNGSLIWSLTGVNSLTIGDAAGDMYGNSYVVNGEYVPQNPGSVITKLSPGGTLIWDQVNSMAGTKVEIGPDNYPVISGFPSSGAFGAAFMKYDDNGNVLWQNLDADGANYNLMAHAQLRLDGAGAAYLAAGIMTQMAFCKVNGDGSSAWTVTVPGSYGYSLDFGSDNSIFVAGGTIARIIQDDQTTSSPETDYSISQINVFPNPFQSEVNIDFTFDASQDIRIWISDTHGRILADLENLKPGTGKFQYKWNPGSINDHGDGMYFLNIQTGKTIESRKLIRIR